VRGNAHASSLLLRQDCLATMPVRVKGTFLMTFRIALLAAKTIALGMTATAALALMVGLHAFAQDSSTPPPAAPAPGEGIQNGHQQVQLIFTPWTRYCAQGLTEKSSEIKTKEVCFTASDGHLPSGQKMVIALVIEPEDGGDAKLLRVTLPLGVALVPGARIVIDEKDAMTAPFIACHPKNGCMADFKADADLITKLKHGQSLAIQAFDKARPISFTLPLTGFAKAYDGPPSDPTALNEQQRSLQNEFQSHSENRLYTPRGK
jgi:invasion protein IalB